VLVAATALAGCSVVTDFDPSRLDGSADAPSSPDARNDGGPDAHDEGTDAHDASDASDADDATDAHDASDASDDVVMPECTVASECPGVDTECRTRVCTMGRCSESFAAAGTALSAQTPGDCHREQCDGAGNVQHAVDDTDLPSDGNQCTLDLCTAGAPSHPPVAVGGPCSQEGGSYCNGLGRCVECTTASHCPGSDTECRARRCGDWSCHVDFAPAGTAVSAQTAGDCRVNQCNGAGGVVAVPDDSDTPASSQCAGAVCMAGVPAHPPVSARTSCSEGGGLMCDGMGACVECLAGGDCPSGVCMAQRCVGPSCSDGVRNGDETDVDCGGSCGACAVDRACTVAADCVSRMCNSAGRCEHTLFVLRVGDGTAALSSAATRVYVERRTLDGTLLETIALPTATSGTQRRFTLGGTAGTEGGLRTSVDGRFVTLAGYDADPGVASVGSTTTSSTPRVVARLDAQGHVDTSTVLTTAFSTGSVRSAVSTNGNEFWISGTSGSSTGGVWRTTLGTAAAGTQVSSTFNNSRWIGIYGGQLYISSTSGTLQGLASVGTGVPSSTGQTTTALPGFPTTTGPGTMGFVGFDLDPSVPGIDTFYVADDRTTTGGGVQHWVSNGTAWELRATLSVGTGAGARSVTGYTTSDGVVLFVTTTETRLVRLVHGGASSGTFTMVAQPATNTAFRGVTLAPYAR
jgi:hypothetical protein